jgi:hypothetical protein
MIEGGCFCGAVRYQLTGSPESSGICHCESCRRASGAPSVAWVTVERERFQILKGEPAAYASSPGVVRRFCDRCGSPLTYESSKAPRTIDITTVTLDDPNRFPPTLEVWLSDRLPWQPTSADLKHYPGSSFD